MHSGPFSPRRWAGALDASSLGSSKVMCVKVSFFFQCYIPRNDNYSYYRGHSRWLPPLTLRSTPSPLSSLLHTMYLLIRCKPSTQKGRWRQNGVAENTHVLGLVLSLKIYANPAKALILLDLVSFIKSLYQLLPDLSWGMNESLDGKALCQQ